LNRWKRAFLGIVGGLGGFTDFKNTLSLQIKNLILDLQETFSSRDIYLALQISRKRQLPVRRSILGCNDCGPSQVGKTSLAKHLALL